MKKLGLLFALTLAVLAIGAQLVIRISTPTMSVVSGTFVNSQVDTLTLKRETNMSAATFWIFPKDSMTLTNVIVRRQFRGVLVPAIAGDTILSSTKVDSAVISYASITLSPYVDTLKLFVAYADSDNGVTTPSVIYGIGKAF